MGPNLNFYQSIFFESFKKKKSLSLRKPNFGGFTSQFLGQTILGFLLVRFEKIVITIKEFLRSSPQQANSVLISLKNENFLEEIQTFHNKELKVFGEVRNFLTNYKVIKKIKGFLFFWSDVISNNLFTKIQSDILGINSICFTDDASQKTTTCPSLIKEGWTAVIILTLSSKKNKQFRLRLMKPSNKTKTTLKKEFRKAIISASSREEK